MPEKPGGEIFGICKIDNYKVTKIKNNILNFGKRIYDIVLGNSLLKRILRTLLGYRYFKLLLPFSGYRACHMVAPGETVVLAGIYNRTTISDYLRVVGNTGRVIVIEANPANVKRLSDIFSGNANLDIVSKAVWNSHGHTQFIAGAGDVQGYNRLDSSELQPFPYHMDDKPLSIDVETDTLDAMMQALSINFINHLNLTINGAELQALDGIQKILVENPNLRIYINSEYPDPFNEVVRKLESMDFKVYTAPILRTSNKKIKLQRIYAIHT